AGTGVNPGYEQVILNRPLEDRGRRDKLIDGIVCVREFLGRKIVVIRTDLREQVVITAHIYSTVYSKTAAIRRQPRGPTGDRTSAAETISGQPLRVPSRCRPSVAKKASSGPVPADGPGRPMQDDLLDKMVGTWKVTGTIARRSIEQACDVGWVLNHQFLRIHFLAAKPKPATRAESNAGVRYEALVFVGYSNMFEHYVVHWIDVFGGHFSQTLGFVTRLAGGRSIRFVFEAYTPLLNTIAWVPRTGTRSMRIRLKN